MSKADSRRASRRRFLRNVGFGVGAPLLAPAANMLVARAQGQAVDRKRLVLFVANQGWPGQFGNGNGSSNVPYGSEGVRCRGCAGQWSPAEFVVPDSAWPSNLEPLLPIKRHVALVDGYTITGLHSQQKHGAAISATSCMPSRSGDRFHSDPGGPSFDWAMAQTSLGEETFVRRALAGVAGTNNETISGMFATGAGGANVPSYTQSPSRFASQIVGGDSGPVSGNGQRARRGMIFDSIRGDVARLSSRLAAPERAGLDEFLSYVEAFEERETRAASLTCEDPVANDPGNAEGRLRGLMSVATLALQCGSTNIVAFGMGRGGVRSPGGHDGFPNFGRNIAPSTFNGHAGTWRNNINGTHRFYTGLLKELAENLSGAPGQAPEDTVMLFLTDRPLTQNNTHHGFTPRWPGVVITGAPQVRTGGRYYRFGQGEGRNQPNLGALFTTVAHVLGQSISGFGQYRGGPQETLLV